MSTIRELLTVFLEHFSPLGAYYTYRDTFDLVSTVLSPCGANAVLNIASDIRASNAQNAAVSGYISTDSVRLILIGTFETNQHLFLSLTSRPMRRSHRLEVAISEQLEWI